MNFSYYEKDCYYFSVKSKNGLRFLSHFRAPLVIKFFTISQFNRDISSFAISNCFNLEFSYRTFICFFLQRIQSSVFPLSSCFPIFIFKYSQNSKILIFKNKTPNINNFSDLLNYPQLTFIYPPSASSLPPPQPQSSTCPLIQSSFHHFVFCQTAFESSNRMPGDSPRRSELVQYLSLNQYNLIFVAEVTPLV